MNPGPEPNLNPSDLSELGQAVGARPARLSFAGDSSWKRTRGRSAGSIPSADREAGTGHLQADSRTRFVMLRFLGREGCLRRFTELNVVSLPAGDSGFLLYFSPWAR